eukprot:TRINITY_DN25170_c0_g4_i1.p1 TRINITY_DN25170_c0_g4~~TRINITY_DN25170_c0_g4_i1.p1  ORF type:complete len:1242 (-),score=201.72 TRINITY_DN25170_c0_g4_i1:135-3860(-)
MADSHSLRAISSPQWARKMPPPAVLPAAEIAKDKTPLLSLGVCCMASKATSAPMQAILRRLEMAGDFRLEVFEEEVILNQPIESWPIVDCLIAFESKGFPLEKCIGYTKLRNPRCINNVEAQLKLGSRRMVYETLTEWGIPCPDYVIVDHNLVKPNGPHEIEEHDNYIVYNGKKLDKPFVEKPEDGDRHDIWIYYPRSIGGGAKKLFRKKKDQSSEYDPHQNNVRRDGVYVYEPFLPTQGTDIKVYTVGAGYVHAEARKAPTVDGKVMRSKDGKEIRYPVVLTQGEKAIAAFIVKAFRQNICGFDILRTDGGSYVCDVNGWSFVKGNQKYYNDCSTLIRKHLLEECGLAGVDTSTTRILAPIDEVVGATGLELSPNECAVREDRHEKLRSVIVVMRHGDRRPKEKLKFKCKHPAVLEYFDNKDPGVTEIKLKSTEELQTLGSRMMDTLARLREDLSSAETSMAASCDDKERGKLEEKVATLKQELVNIELLIPVLQMEDCFSGLERKVQLKAVKWKSSEDTRMAAQVQIVAKWGGELTVSGLAQAEDLGRRLRHDLYPGDPTGLLRLHSSFRHDFKIYSSQEGRCQITAAAFTKGFLELEGDIIPILVSLVTRDEYAQRLLDEPIPKKERDAVKRNIESILLSYTDMSSKSVLERACPTGHEGLREASRRIESPLQLLHTIKCLTLEYIESISTAKDKTFNHMKMVKGHGNVSLQDLQEEDADDDLSFVNRQRVPDPMIPFGLKDELKRKWLHLRRKEHRWRKLFDGFVRVIDEEKGTADDSNVTFDPSKIPDVWDNLYYDMLTHRNYLGEDSCKLAEMMVGLIHPLNEWVCLSEYGITEEEKLRIGVDVTWRLIGKMLGDLEFMIAGGAGRVDEAGRILAEDAARGSLIPRTLSEIGSEGALPRSVSNVGSESNISRVLSNPPGTDLEHTPAKPTNDVAPSFFPQDAFSFTPPVRSHDVQTQQKKSLVEEVTLETLEPSGVPSSGLKAATAASIAGAHAAQGTEPRNSEWREWGTWETSEEKESRELPSPRSPENSMAANSEDSVDKSEKGKKHVRRPSNALKSELTRAMCDSADWHPRLNDAVNELTDLKNTTISRSRIYVTSASTMHSLFNILRHGHSAGGACRMISDLGHVTDLNYLTHIVFRCYERERKHGGDGSMDEKSRYRVEISMSQGVQTYEAGRLVPWPRGSQLSSENCQVAPLEVICESVELADLEKFLTDVVKEFGGNDAETADEKGSE